ncbi:MAG: ATP-binding cassette, subfamily multidrug efflux pump [Actinomycetota bacterium]|nr:ATP-binding cassette, subfamily multidrug efflux pump [Actinomycetota bacterium]
MRRLLTTYLRPARRLLAAVLVFQAAQAVLTLYLTHVSADIIDRGVLRRDSGYIWSSGRFMLALTGVQVLCAVASVYFAARASMGFGRDVRADLFHRVTDFSAREVARFGAPTLITRVTNDVQQVQMMVMMTCTMAVAAPITALAGIVLAVREAPGMVWLIGVSVPMLLALVGLILRRMHPMFIRLQDQIDTVNQVLREQIAGIRVVRAFVRESSETARFGEANDGLTATSLRQGRLMARMFPLVMLGVNVSSVAVLWVGARGVNSHQLSVGALIAFLTYLTQILTAVLMATFMFMMLPRAAVSGKRIMEVLETPSSLVVSAAPIGVPAATGLLELRGVGFGYPGAQSPVLTDISFVAGPGQTTAIIGSTGAGKSTLLSLIARLADVTDGSVLVDGVDVRDLAPEALWSRIGLVPQHPFLFSGTVASNLRFGRPQATEAEMWEALRVAQAADFVEAMPGGLDAPITQGGTNVSGGQRQRLAIARALIHRPEIYLFDDSFSALDLATDARLRAALTPYVALATTIVVAQRVSTIVDADRIIVLEDGRVVGQGTHAELLSGCPTYAEIVASQLTATEAAA